MGLKKGKKAWRGLDDSQVVEHVQQESWKERHGPGVESLQDDQLFFVDKAADTQQAQQAADGRRPKAARVKRPTRAQLILQAPQQVKPVIHQPRPAKRKDQGSAAALAPLAKRKQQAVPPPQAQQQMRSRKQGSGPEQDLWSGDGAGLYEEWGEQPSTSAPAAPHRSSRVMREELLPFTARGPSIKRKGTQRKMAPPIKALEVDMAGCSYNPDEETHQDAIAALVAAENKKLLRKELEPAPPQLMDPADIRMQDELEQLQTYAEEDEDDNEIKLGGSDEEGGRGGAGGDARRAHKSIKKTTKDRNRQARRLTAEQEADVKRALKEQRAQFERLVALQKQLEEEQEEGKRRLLRRQVVKAEKAASQPPRLSKIRFEDMPVQVLTSEEVGAGLRRLRGCPMLALDRFKSIQKRGLIEPRRRNPPKAPGRVVEYEKQARRERAVEGQAELAELVQANKKSRAALKLRS